jgi:hypothetical protein
MTWHASTRERTSWQQPVALSPQSIADALVAAHPSPVEDALRLETDGGLPAKPGFYAWWVARGSIDGSPHHPHPARPGLGLLYIGISPKRPTSGGLIRSRVVDQHLRGNTASSTLRFVLAAFLLDELNLTPRATTKKVILDREDNARLRQWQFDHLKLTWCERARPWEVEDAVIALLQPPLNCAANESHPFHPRVTAARAAFRAAAPSHDAASVYPLR